MTAASVACRLPGRSGPAMLLGILMTSFASIADTEFRSGPQQVSMVELYTSQGCSSCPPADRWMSGLIDQPGLWKDFVPLAFHVDYWDYIGWQDPFAQPEFSQRQRKLAAEEGLEFVYTPGFLLDGREWRQWRSALAPTATKADAGLLVVKLESDRVSVSYSTSLHHRDGLVANVAILAFGFESSVLKGENSGRKLRNDFVVRDVATSPMTQTESRFESALPMPSRAAGAERYAVVVWVSGNGSLSPLQSLGGWLDPSS